VKRERIQIVPESSRQTAGVTDLTGVGAVILAAGSGGDRRERSGMPGKFARTRTLPQVQRRRRA